MHCCRTCGKDFIVGANWYESSKRHQNYNCITCHTAFYRSKYDPQKNKTKVKKYDENLKREAMNNYGGVCACCREKELYFLTIDHINNDGRADRDKKLVGIKMYGWMRKNNYPDKDRFRVLCYNCNYMLGSYGICEHNSDLKKDKCFVCNEHLVERLLFARNYVENFHLFFKKSNLNICMKCAMEVKDVTSLNSRVSRLNKRVKVIDAYGGKCECCEELNYCFLTIDHVNGITGNCINDRNINLYKKLIDNNFPKDDYRLLCYNCNCSRGHFGVCPHEKQRHISVFTEEKVING
jgi:hypothetical protein